VPSKHETARALGADHVIDSRSEDLAAEVPRLTGENGADLVLETAGGATFDASLAAARRVTGRVVVYGMAAGDAATSNWDPVYKHEVHVIGFKIGVLAQAAPQIYGEVMRELSALIAAGVLTRARPPAYDLAEARRRSRSWQPAPRSANWPWCRDEPRPLRLRDRPVPPGAVGALLPHGRLETERPDPYET
jgi:NADPH:quinone reductase-like Zn-dependent oxidoreductase